MSNKLFEKMSSELSTSVIDSYFENKSLNILIYTHLSVQSEKISAPACILIWYYLDNG